ncbi:MAG: Fe(2+)-trafficking protein [Gemmatimonadota bacterium]
MSGTTSFQCVRCDRDDAIPVPSPPFRDDLGRRITREICTECWEEWKERQMLLINHFGLDLRAPEAREFLRANLRSYLFDEGSGGADIDTSQEGQVEW